MDSTLESMKDGESTVGGGVEDVYGEDRATEDQLVTPWTTSVASGYTLLRDPRHNKGLAFTERERDSHYLRGLLPPAVSTQELQEKKLMQSIRNYEVPLYKYVAMMELERLFYKLLIDNVEELLLVVYTPTVGEACQKYRSIFKRPQGLYISLKEKGKFLEAHAASAVLNFSENCTPDILTPYLDGIVSKLLMLLQNGKQMVQEGALTALASVADSSQEQFQKYYDAVMPYLKAILVNANDKANRML
ncbi:hypothetical protein LXL04_001549 [Taraxacum kok-saghyz]